MIQIINPFKLVFVGLIFVAVATSLPASVIGQGFNVYFQQADLDSDGEIAPHEITGSIKRYLVSRGYDVDKRHKIKDLLRHAGTDTGTGQEPKAETVTESSNLKVPKFGVEAADKVSVGGFGAVAETVEYSETVNKQTRQLFEKYDRNENGVMDNWEIARMSWGSPRPSVSDKNGDGRLSYREIQDRYRDREIAKQGSDQSSQASSGSRDSEERSEERSGGRGRYVRPEGESRSDRSYSRGSRDGTNSSSRSSSSRPSVKASVDMERKKREQVERYVESYFKTRDLDQNDVLEGDELKKVSSKARYDKNRDGKITKAEMYEASAPLTKATTTKSATSSSSKSSRSSSSRSSSSRTTSNGSSSFNKLDVNKDGLVQMHEFSKTWTEKKLKEFVGKDEDGDGVISPSEW